MQYHSSMSKYGLEMLLGDGKLVMPGLILEETVATGRSYLIHAAGCDFGYAPYAWFKHLYENNVDSFTDKDAHLAFPHLIRVAANNARWHEAVAIAEEVKLMEFLELRKWRRRAAREEADAQWRGKLRPCPDCGNEFKSVLDRGVCTKCGKLFSATHPLGRTDWCETLWTNWKLPYYATEWREDRPQIRTRRVPG